MAKFAYHTAYIAAAPAEFQPLLTQLRATLAATLPDAQEVILYDMPGFAKDKSIIAGYAAFTKQCGLYVSKGVITAHHDNIAAAGLKSTKTGVTFSVKKPIPENLISDLAIASRKELGV